MYDRVKVAAKKPKAEEFKTAQTQKSKFNNYSSSLDQILFLQRTIGNQAVERMIRNVHSPSSVVREQTQAKLKIGQPNDIYEQEADRVAEQIVSSSWSVVNNQMEEGEIQRQTEEEERKREEEKLVQSKLKTNVEHSIQRQVEEEDEKEEETLQLKKMQGDIPEVTPDLESRIRALRGGGQLLTKPIRAFFEPRFGYDFSQVRIHNDPEGAKLARVLNAEAFTYGRDIYFGEGRYNPGTLTGKRLLAHELTHVVQQSTNYIHGKKAKKKPKTGKANRLSKVREEAMDRGRDEIVVNGHGISIIGLPQYDLWGWEERKKQLAEYLSRPPLGDVKLISEIIVTTLLRTGWNTHIGPGSIEWSCKRFHDSPKKATLGVLHELGHLVFNKGKMPPWSSKKIKEIFYPRNWEERINKMIKKRNELTKTLEKLVSEGKLTNKDKDKFSKIKREKDLTKMKKNLDKLQGISEEEKNELKNLIEEVFKLFFFIGYKIAQFKAKEKKWVKMRKGEFFAQAYMYFYRNKPHRDMTEEMVAYLCYRDYNVRGKPPSGLTLCQVVTFTTGSEVLANSHAKTGDGLTR